MSSPHSIPNEHLPSHTSRSGDSKLIAKAATELRRLVEEDQVEKACEIVLVQYPQLHSNRDAVLELIYLEHLFRQESKQIADPNANEGSFVTLYSNRFPELRDELEKLFQVSEAIGSEGFESSLNEFDTPLATPRRAMGASAELTLGYLKDYCLLEEVGRGGMGIVYRALQQSLGRIVALKTLNPMERLDVAAMSRFQKEAELASGLQHPNIVQIFEVGSHDGSPFFSMEYIAGGNLAQSFSVRPLSANVAARAGAAIARAVAHAHEHQVVHRDLKPSNVLLAPSSRPEAIELPATQLMQSGRVQRVEPKIADFGLAIATSELEKQRGGGQAIGTPSYMAPEQFCDSFGAVGPACDIYAIGAILYHAVAGRPPFQAASAQETLALVREREPLPLRELVPRLSGDFDTICAKCLQKDPARRYESAHDLAADLQRFLDQIPIRARPASPVHKALKWSRRHPSAAALIILVMAAMAIVTGLWRHAESSRESERIARQRGEQMIYDRQIALAHSEYRSHDLDRCKAILSECDPKFRHWEWDYLNSLSSESIWSSQTHRLDVISNALSPDGKYVAIGRGQWNANVEQSIEVWDVDANQLVWNLKGHPESEVACVGFSHDGRFLLSSAVVSNSKEKEKGKVILWDMSTGQAARTIVDANARVARFMPDGQHIVVGTTEGRTAIYRIATGELVREDRQHGGIVLDIATGIGGRYISTSRDGVVCLWQMETGLITRVTEMGDVRQVAWAPDGAQVLLQTYGGRISTFDFYNDQLLLAKTETMQEFARLAFSPDGMILARAIFGQGVELIRTWNHGYIQTLHGHRGNIRSLSFDSSGCRIATGGSDGAVRVWDLTVEKSLSSKTLSTASIADIDYHPSKPIFAIATRVTPTQSAQFSGKPRIELRDTSSMKLLKSMVGHEDWLTSIEFSPSGDRVVTGSLDNTVRIWNIESADCLTTFRAHAAPIVETSFVSASQIASVDREGNCCVWEMEHPEQTKKICFNVDGVTNAVFFKERKLCVLGDRSRVLSCWDLNTGRMLSQRTMDTEIAAIAVSPNQRWFAVNGPTNTIHTWDIDDFLKGAKQPTLESIGNSDAITSMCFSPDSMRLISGSDDESVRVFELSLGTELLKLDGLRGLDNIVRFSADGGNILRVSGRNYRQWSTGDHAFEKNPKPKSRLDWHIRKAYDAQLDRQLNAAIFHCQKAIEVSPENSVAWDFLARCKFELNDLSSAESIARKCLERQYSSRAIALLDEILLMQGRLDEFRLRCQEYAKVESDDLTQINHAAWALSSVPTIEVDFTVLSQKLKSALNKKKVSYVVNTLAMVQYRAGKYDDAIQNANEAIRLVKAERIPESPHNLIILLLCRIEKMKQGTTEVSLPADAAKSKKEVKELESMLVQLYTWFAEINARRKLGLSDTNSAAYENWREVPYLVKELQSKWETAQPQLRKVAWDKFALDPRPSLNRAAHEHELAWNVAKELFERVNRWMSKQLKAAFPTRSQLKK